MPKASKTDWKRLDAMTDEDIARQIAKNPDAAPLLDEEWFAKARVVMPAPGPTPAISIRLDPEVVTWFKGQGPKYQTRINAVLKAYVNAQQRKGQAPLKKFPEMGRRKMLDKAASSKTRAKKR
ncbi:MAG: BrnA antitoxin family protein [Gemmatimonadales bacterium]